MQNPTKMLDVSISLCDHMNPGFGYQMRITNALNGEELLFTSVHPATGRDLLTYDECLDVANMYRAAPQTGPASAVITRHRLESAIARGLESAAEAESRRTMERSLLISYIADAVEHASATGSTQIVDKLRVVSAILATIDPAMGYVTYSPAEPTGRWSAGLTMQIASDEDLLRLANTCAAEPVTRAGDNATSWLGCDVNLGALRVRLTGPHHKHGDPVTCKRPGCLVTIPGADGYCNACRVIVKVEQDEQAAVLDAAGPDDVVIGGRGDGPVVITGPGPGHGPGSGRMPE